MNTTYSKAKFSDGLVSEAFYKNLDPDFKKPRLFDPLRIRLGKSHKYIANDHIYDWTEFKEAVPMRGIMEALPDYLLEVGFEFGVELKSINRKMVYDGVIDFRKKRIRINLEDFGGLKDAGCYEPGARLVAINNKYLNKYISENGDTDINPIAYFMGKAFQHAILSNKYLLKMPECLISYDNRFLPYYVIRYALKKDVNYFSLSLEQFLSNHRYKDLKYSDRPMFRFMEMLFGKHPSTMKEEEVTGVSLIH